MNSDAHPGRRGAGSMLQGIRLIKLSAWEPDVASKVLNPSS